MKPEVLYFNDSKFDPDQNLLFDTNVLLFIFSGNDDSTEQESDIKKYDEIFYYALHQKNNIFITPLTLSEFVNRQTRLAYDIYIKEHNLERNSFTFKKNFRKLGEYRGAYDDAIFNIEHNILPYMTILNIEHDDIKDISEHTDFMMDFNDAIFYKIATKNNLTIVTDDSDFFYIDTKSHFKVVTYNFKASKAFLEKKKK